MVEHNHYKMLKNLILHITYLISRLHSSINKRIASLFEMISAITSWFCVGERDAKASRSRRAFRGAHQQHPLSMNAGSTLPIVY